MALTAAQRELLELLSRARRVALLASKTFAQAASVLQSALESRNCNVIAAVESTSAAISSSRKSEQDPAGQTGGVDAVVILGESPTDASAFQKGGPLETATRAVFAAVQAKAPVRVLGENVELEVVEELAGQLKDLPCRAGDAEKRWAEAANAVLLDDAADVAGCLEKWPELRSACDASGSTLLHLAAELGALEAIAALLRKGAALLTKNGGELTAGDAAFDEGHQEAFEMLVTERIDQLLSEREKQGEEALEDGKERCGPPRKRRRSEEDCEGSPSKHEEYLNESLRYEGSRLLDSSNKAVMMGWEAPLMEKHAEALLPEPGGCVANVGFGLGLVDTFLQRRGPKSHIIIEAHKDVLAEMERQGWDKRPGVTVKRGRWQDVIGSIAPGSLDAIFFDTWCETYENDVLTFLAHLPRLLRPGGRFSFFNGLAPYSIAEHAAFCRLAQVDLQRHGLLCDICPLEIGGLGDATWAGVAERYWQFSTYYMPLARFQSASETASGAAWRCWPDFPVRAGDKIGERLPHSEFSLA